MDLKEYFEGFNTTLTECLKDVKCYQGLAAAVEMLKQTKMEGTKIILIGNGGSAAIAEHMAIDLTKNAGLRAITISGSPQMTTFANDYGYENIYSKGIEAYADRGDVLVAISSGGTSPNILNAVKAARKIGCKVVTFSGFEKGNPLGQMGDINIYVATSAYGYVEIIHNLLIHYINDQIIGKAVYKIS
ncbi:MAG: SIS domain-containing protein [Candidatus Margulisbacteria bacterium]|nr:SIS domain-containing protein [Candidatus Margulisiibacteriota bacterium]MBU1021524.1 SIS domain-containing protein [Candidatus Margulisiibacteriota bacterium]MBU1728609.1 SIS domain-containing protein [Candidatus Margulisiibacteriota bacterium]MBU1955812.1 SIS domain-containing protein [Candidatus Margulisiibacteriota bacterium]